MNIKKREDRVLQKNKKSVIIRKTPRILGVEDFKFER